MAVECKGDADDLAVPAGELQRVRAPADVRANRRHLAVVLARPPSPGMAFEHEPVLLHQPENTFGVDRSLAGGSPLALEERGDPPIAIGRALVDQAADVGGELDVALTGLRATLRPVPFPALDDVRSCHAQRRGDGLHGESPGRGERDSKVGFFARARSSASLRISTSMVLRPSSRSSSRTRSSSRRTAEAVTTSSSARTASCPLAHQPSPAKHQARAKPVAPRNIADRHARLHRLGDDRQFLLG